MLLSFSDIIDKNFVEVGGKAYNLAVLDGLGIAVPTSIVIGPDSLKEVLSCNSVSKLHEEISARLANNATVDDATMEKFRDAIRQHPPSAADTQALTEWLNEHGLSKGRFAVRSSAAAEDSQKFSFAGVHRSHLNVSSDKLWPAIRDVQASFWAPSAIAYRRRSGLDDVNFLGSVLICEMIGSDTADSTSGVLFTKDPVANRFETFIIECVSGFGDKLVGGHETPSRAVYDVKSSEFTFDSAFHNLMRVEKAQELCSLALRIRDILAMGDDNLEYDLEWTCSDSEITVLQARPITNSATALPNVREIWSQTNLIEVLPGILSPLSWSLTKAGIRWALLEPFDNVTDVSKFQILKRIDGRPFLELSALQYLSFTQFGLPPHEFNQALGGNLPEIKTADLQGSLKERIKRAIRISVAGTTILTLKRKVEKDIARSQKLESLFLSKDLQTLTLEQMNELWEEIAIFSATSAISKAAGASVPWMKVLRSLVPKSVDNNTFLSMVAGMIAGSGKIVSAEHALCLAALARFKDQPNYLEKRKRFLEQYGHRGFHELEIENPRWREDEKGIDTLVDELHTIEDTGQRVESRQSEAKALMSNIPFYIRAPVRYFSRKVGASFRLREAARSESVRILGCLRLLTLELGERLHKNGKIAFVQDVFYLSIFDLNAVMNESWDGSGAGWIIKKRKAIREGWRSDPPPEYCVIFENEFSTSHRPLQKERLVTGRANSRDGLPASPGRIVGRAVVISSPDQADRILPGDIVVTSSTDPTWTPLFLLASGLVVEHGGFLSHGAIVAREFGIPAVVDVSRVTLEINDGDIITLDATVGRVSWTSTS